MNDILKKYFEFKNTEEDIDNTVKEDGITKTVRLGVENVQLDRIFVYEDTTRVNCTSTLGTSIYDIESYGRECLLLNFSNEYFEETIDNTTYIRDVRIYGKIYCRDENGNFVQKEEFAGWHSIDWSTNYYGDDQRITGPLESLRRYGERFGSGVLSFAVINGLYGKKAVLNANIPIFENIDDVSNYIYTGEYDNAINKFGEDVNKVWFYDYIISDYNESTHKLTNSHEYHKNFKLKNSSDKVRFVKDGENTAHLQFNCSTVLERQGTDFVEVPIDDTFIYNVIINKSIKGKYGDLYTNIPIVGNFDDALDEAENFTNEHEPNYTGEDSLMDNSIVTGVTSPLGCYYLSSNELRTVKNWLFTTDRSLFDTMKEHLWQYNENPSECIVALVYIPFSITPYCSVNPKALQFGSLIFNGTIDGIPSLSYSNIDASWGKVTHVNTRIIPTYNDFRDYETIKYSVYMPYYGILELDSSCVGQTLRIVSFFNAWTVQLTYYVYIGTALVGEYTCDVGQQLSITGNNWLTKSKQNVNDFMGAYGGLGSLASSLVHLDLGGAISGISQSVSSSMNYLGKPTTMTTGVNSGGMNIYDDMNFYLIVESYETVKPLNLEAEYGTPCFKIAPLNTCVGFTTIEDIKLTTGATEEEQNEIKQLLMEGVII